MSAGVRPIWISSSKTSAPGGTDRTVTSTSRVGADGTGVTEGVVVDATMGGDVTGGGGRLTGGGWWRDRSGVGEEAALNGWFTMGRLGGAVCGWNNPVANAVPTSAITAMPAPAAQTAGRFK